MNWEDLGGGGVGEMPQMMNWFSKCLASYLIELTQKVFKTINSANIDCERIKYLHLIHN